jgi:hypothetical protein
MSNLSNFFTGLELFAGVNNTDGIGHAPRMKFVERFYSKRPILCLASSKILTLHRLSSVCVCTPLPLLQGEDTLAGWNRGKGWVVNILEDARYCLVLYIRKYFVVKLIAAASVLDTGGNFIAASMIINDRQY